MTHEDFNKLQLDLFTDILEMAKTKGIEYSSDRNERLANFKRLAVELEIPASKVGYIYFKKHLDSINTYLKEGRVYSDEGIRGRFVDAINYLTLIYGLIVDETERVKIEEKKQDYATSILHSSNSICRECGENLNYLENIHFNTHGYLVHNRCHENEKTQKTRTSAKDSQLDARNTRQT